MTRKTALYRHFDAAHSLLYIGISLSAVQRLKQHMGDKEWAGDIAAVTVEHFDTREDALDAERKAIQNEKPRWNIAHNKRGRPNLWDDCFRQLEAGGNLFDSPDDAEAACEARRQQTSKALLACNPNWKEVSAKMIVR